MNGSNQDAINEVVMRLVKRVESLEADNKSLWQIVESLEHMNGLLRKDVNAVDTLLFHQVPRIDDIEQKIDWSK